MSLKAYTKKKILDEMLRQVRNPGRFRVLIVDSPSLKILNGVCKGSDIDEYVALVEDLSRPRKPRPQYDAIYFIQSSMESINRIIDDFRGPPPYASVNIFCCGVITPTMMDKLRRTPVNSYITNLKDLYIEYAVAENQVFQLNRENSIYSLYSDALVAHRELELDQMAKQVACVFSTLGERPLIRFHDPNQVVERHGGSVKSIYTCSRSSKVVDSLPLTAKFAYYLQQHVDELSGVDSSFPSSSEIPTILIVDRSVDMLSPLLHEYTYQAMVAEFIGIEEGGKVRWQMEGNEQTFVTLDESDPIWCDIRHLHIGAAAQYLEEGVKKFTSDNKAAQWARNDGSSSGSSLKQINQIQEALTALPQYTETKTRLSLHTDFCSYIMNQCQVKMLNQIASIEQELGTGETEEFKATKVFLRSIVDILDNRAVGKPEKLRLALMFVISQNGVEDTELHRIMDHPGLGLSDSEKLVFLNLHMLGVRLSKSFDSSRNGNTNPFAHVNRLHKIKRTETEFGFNRYVPAIKSVMEDHLKGQIPEESFPYTIPPPETPGTLLSDMMRGGQSTPLLRNTKPSWASKKNAANTVQTGNSKEVAVSGPKLMVFVLGGMTYSEIRSAYEITKEFGKEVIIGSSHIFSQGSTSASHTSSGYSPLNFVEILKYLHRGAPVAGTQPRGESRQRMRMEPSSTTQQLPSRPVMQRAGSYSDIHSPTESPHRIPRNASVGGMVGARTPRHHSTEESPRRGASLGEGLRSHSMKSRPLPEPTSSSSSQRTASLPTQEEAKKKSGWSFLKWN